MPKDEFFGSYEALEVDQHVSCCGISHLHEFPDAKNSTIAQRVVFIRDAVEIAIDSALYECYGDLTANENNIRHCLEVTLTEDQAKKWEEPLYEIGFKKTFTFLNSKSGNRCNVYHFETNRPESEK